MYTGATNDRPSALWALSGICFIGLLFIMHVTEIKKLQPSKSSPDEHVNYTSGFKPKTPVEHNDYPMDLENNLRKLKKVLEDGLVNEEDFEEKKKEILKEIWAQTRSIASSDRVRSRRKPFRC